EHLDATIPGTYGTIRETLRHLVESEEGYFYRVTGERLSERMPEGPVALDELAERIRRLGPRWEQLAGDGEVQSRLVVTSDGRRLLAGVRGAGDSLWRCRISLRPQGDGPRPRRPSRRPAAAAPDPRRGDRRRPGSAASRAAGHGLGQLLHERP